MTDEKKRDEPFRDMAEKIAHNHGSPFGGAVVIVPPDNGGGVISTLILDTSGDAAQFWALLQTKAKYELEQLGNNNRMAQAGFQRR